MSIFGGEHSLENICKWTGNYWVVAKKDDCLLITASPFGGADEYWFDITQFAVIKQVR